MADSRGATGGGMRNLRLARRALFAVALFALVVVLVGRLVPGAATRLEDASAGLLAVAVGLELLACAGYVAIFHATFARPPDRLDVVRSAQIGTGELAGFALVPVGAGGPALRFWALLASRVPLSRIATRTVSFGAVFNLPYVLAALILGLGSLAGLLPGHAPAAVELAPLGLVAVSVATMLALVALARSDWLARPGPRRARVRAVVAIAPAGLRDIPALLRSPLALTGAGAYWALDCATLLTALHAVGARPPLAVVALGYMLGQVGNLAPLPGGIGGVEPIMLGVLVSSGVATATAAAAVVCYRAIALGVQGASGALAFATLLPVLTARRRRARLK